MLSLEKPDTVRMAIAIILISALVTMAARADDGKEQWPYQDFLPDDSERHKCAVPDGYESWDEYETELWRRRAEEARQKQKLFETQIVGRWLLVPVGEASIEVDGDFDVDMLYGVSAERPNQVTVEGLSEDYVEVLHFRADHTGLKIGEGDVEPYDAFAWHSDASNGEIGIHTSEGEWIRMYVSCVGSRTWIGLYEFGDIEEGQSLGELGAVLLLRLDDGAPNAGG